MDTKTVYKKFFAGLQPRVLCKALECERRVKAKGGTGRPQEHNCLPTVCLQIACQQFNVHFPTEMAIKVSACKEKNYLAVLGSTKRLLDVQDRHTISSLAIKQGVALKVETLARRALRRLGVSETSSKHCCCAFYLACRANRVSLKKPEAVKWAEINVKEFDSICQNLREACPDLEPPKPLRSKANPNTPGKTPTTESASTDTRPTTAHGIDSTVNEDNIPATGKSGKKTVRNTRAKTHTPTPTRAQSNGECAGESTAVRESNESERLTDSEKDGDTNTHTQGNTAGDTHTRTPGHAHGSMHKVLDEGVGSDKESAVIRSRSVVTTKRADGLMAAAKLQATPSTSANQIAENRKRRPMKTTDSSRKFTPGKPSNLAGGARKKLKTNEMEPIEEREGETELQTQSGVAKGLRFFQTDRNNESFAEFSARIIAAARLKQKLAVNKNDVSGVGVSVSAEDVPALGTAGMAA